MDKKSEYLIEKIFRKLKGYNSKEIFLEKKLLNKFINLLFEEN